MSAAIVRPDLFARPGFAGDLPPRVTRARKIFEAVADKWKTDKATGVKLYEFAQKMAKDLGWELNLDLGGHRLGDYSSAEHYEGPLHEIAFHPKANIWMVEIHIRNPQNTFGAFYEDLLV